MNRVENKTIPRNDLMVQEFKYSPQGDAPTLAEVWMWDWCPVSEELMHRAVLFLVQLMRWGCVQQMFPISDHNSQLQKVPGSIKQCDLQQEPAWLGPLHLSCVVSADVTPDWHFFIRNQGGELKKPGFSRCLEPSEGQWSTQGGVEGHMNPSASLKT